MRLFNRRAAGLAVLVAALLCQLMSNANANASTVHPLTAGAPVYSQHDGRCLDEDVSSVTHSGTKVQVWDCNGWNNQGWTYYTDGTIRNSHDGRCLDEDVSSVPHNGTKVQVWECNGWDNQKWYHP